jgi:hypothetical protein
MFKFNGLPVRGPQIVALARHLRARCRPVSASTLVILFYNLV